ncbi:MAG: hypothetical protein KC519_16775, partial [Anaerolineae bacterium]|nr:hypothetical protein [Anaerolineae bacterium]
MATVKSIATTDVQPDSRRARSAMPRALLTLTSLTIIGVIVGLYLALGYAGTEIEQGDVQRIFYTHVATFSGAAVAFSATVIGGILYLR